MIFHLAIPAEDLAISTDWYIKLGCVAGRKSNVHQVLNFFGSQLVLHHSPIIWSKPTMYPRHHGLILPAHDDLMNIWVHALSLHFELFEPLFTRHKDEFAEHMSFFLVDPSHNVLEFKYYKNQEAIFG